MTRHHHFELKLPYRTKETELYQNPEEMKRRIVQDGMKQLGGPDWNGMKFVTLGAYSVYRIHFCHILPEQCAGGFRNIGSGLKEGRAKRLDGIPFLW